MGCTQRTHSSDYQKRIFHLQVKLMFQLLKKIPIIRNLFKVSFIRYTALKSLPFSISHNFLSLRFPIKKTQAYQKIHEVLVLTTKCLNAEYLKLLVHTTDCIRNHQIFDAYYTLCYILHVWGKQVSNFSFPASLTCNNLYEYISYNTWCSTKERKVYKRQNEKINFS